MLKKNLIFIFTFFIVSQSYSSPESPRSKVTRHNQAFQTYLFAIMREEIAIPSLPGDLAAIWTYPALYDLTNENESLPHCNYVEEAIWDALSRLNEGDQDHSKLILFLYGQLEYLHHLIVYEYSQDFHDQRKAFHADCMNRSQYSKQANKYKTWYDSKHAQR